MPRCHLQLYVHIFEGEKEFPFLVILRGQIGWPWELAERGKATCIIESWAVHPDRFSVFESRCVEFPSSFICCDTFSVRLVDGVSERGGMC